MNEEVQQWAAQVVGKMRSFTVGVIDPLWAQRYAVAVDDLNPLYFDAEYARRHGYEGIIAPPNYLTTLRDDLIAGPADAELLVDGTGVNGRPGAPGLQVMGGGQEVDFHQPVYCGERIVGEKGISRVEERQGRTGPLVTVEEEIRYRNEGGELKITLRNTTLCRVVEGGVSTGGR